MRLNSIDYKYLGIGTGYTIFLYVFHLIYKQLLKSKKCDDSDNSDNSTGGSKRYTGNVFYNPNKDSSPPVSTTSCIDTEYGCCPDGTTYATDASGTNCKNTTTSESPDSKSSNQMIYVTINIIVYFSILMMWYFEHGDSSMMQTLMYSGVACLISTLLLYITFVGVEHVMESNDDNTNDQSSSKNYCIDPCNWYNKDQCSKNLTWNGVACAWDAAQSTCKTPKTSHSAKNILRTVVVLLTLIILFISILYSDNIKELIKHDKHLVWLLDIPAFLERCKQDLRITTPTIWILLVVEIIILILYCFSNQLAYQAYHKDGTLIYHPPIGTSFQTNVGCNVLNLINDQQSFDSSNTDKSNNLIVIRKGWITNLFPFLTDCSSTPIPDETYTLSTDFVVKNSYTNPSENSDIEPPATDTRTLNANLMINNEFSNVDKMNTTNYNYGISLWFYIDPHQPGKPHNGWYSLFNFDDKPKLLYNQEQNALQIQTIQSGANGLNTTKTSRDVPEVPLQKWNHIFINNVGGTVDLFLNAEVVANIAQVIPHSSTSKITIGQNGGIVGRMCNVMYFKKTLNKLQINDIYRKYQNYNPPIL